MNAALGAYNKLKEVGMGICSCLYEVQNNYIVFFFSKVLVVCEKNKYGSVDELFKKDPAKVHEQTCEHRK